MGGAGEEEAVGEGGGMVGGWRLAEGGVECLLERGAEGVSEEVEGLHCLADEFLGVGL